MLRESPSIHYMPSMSSTYQQYQMPLWHWCCFSSPSSLCLFLCSFFNLLSSPPPFHHRYKPFIHMPAIQSCIPVDRTSVTAYTSTCCLSLITAPQPSAQLTQHSEPQRKNERTEMLVCSYMSGALQLVNSRWHHRPIILHNIRPSPPVCFVTRAQYQDDAQRVDDFSFLVCCVWFERQKTIKIAQEKKAMFRHIFPHDSLNNVSSPHCQQ